MTVVAARNVLLGTIDREVLEGVDRGIGAELDRVGTLYVDVAHMMRLIEQNRRLAPGLLLRSPVGVFGRNDGINVSADFRIPKKRYRITDFL